MKWEKNQEKLDALAKIMLGEFTQAEADRRLKEIEWEENLRQVKGIYDPEILQNIEKNSSKVYPRYTRSKEIPAIAKLNNILLPAFGENWDIKPTPNPHMDKADLDMIATAIAQQAQTNPEFAPDPDYIAHEIEKLAKQRCDNMKRTIKDQLVEANYRSVIKKVIKSGIRYGTGIWKGPLSKEVENKKYSYENGQIFQKNEKTFVPHIEYVPIWRWYPDMSTSEVEETSYIFQQHCLTISDVYALMKKPGFDTEVIKQILREYPRGNYTLKNWEQSLLMLNETQSSTNYKGSKVQPSVRGFEMLERWGLVDGVYLKYAGIDDEDIEDDVMYESVAWILCGRMVKLVLSPLKNIAVNARPFNVFYYDKDESSIFGEGLPRTIRGTAISIGAAARMILDNAATVSGPQLEVNVDLLHEDTDVETFYPNKIWYRNGVGVNAQFPAIRHLSFDSHISEYMNIIQMFKTFGDEESALPAFLFTEPNRTNVETATGMDVRNSNTNVTLGDIVKNFDEPNENFIRAMYKWNLEFNDNPNIKGDYSVSALGSSSIMNKETRNLLLTQFASTLTEEERMYLKKEQYLRARAELMELDPSELLKSEAEVLQELQQRRDPELEQLQKEQIKAEIEYSRAKAASMISKAKNTLEDGKLKNIELQKQLRGVDNGEQGNS